MQGMERNFWRAEKPGGDGAGTGPARCVSRHAGFSPCPRKEFCGDRGIPQEDKSSGQAELTAVGMAAKHQRIAEGCGLRGDLWAVREKDRG